MLQQYIGCCRGVGGGGSEAGRDFVIERERERERESEMDRPRRQVAMLSHIYICYIEMGFGE